MFAGRSRQEWIDHYAHSHRHPFNRLCHSLGIPMIVVSVPLFVATVMVPGLWPVPVALFVVGWALQFAGHAVEGKPPEFFKDWRFLFVGVSWWLAKMQGRA